MAAGLVAVSPPADGMYRLARGPAEPFAPPDWYRADEDGTFGNRFDDPGAEEGRLPNERFRTVYCATQRAAAFGETVARFRPSPRLLTYLDAIDDDEPVAASLAGAVDPEDHRRGLIPADWRLRRRIGQSVLDPALAFVDIAAAETMQHLRAALAPLAASLGLDDIDLSALTSQQRRLTQGAARYVYEQRGPSGRARYAGLRYPSRLNPHEWECWAIFDDRIRHQRGWPGLPASIFPDDADLMAVTTLFTLTIEVFPGRGQYVRP